MKVAQFVFLLLLDPILRETSTKIDVKNISTTIFHGLYSYQPSGFIKVLNRRATEFDTRAKNWPGREGLVP